jgi:hypothetical protein
LDPELPDGFFQKIPNLGKIWRALEWKMFLYFMTIWNNLRLFGIIYGLFVKFVVIWYIFTFWYVWAKKNLATLVGSFNVFLSIFPKTQQTLILLACMYVSSSTRQNPSYEKGVASARIRLSVYLGASRKQVLRINAVNILNKEVGQISMLLVPH